MLLGSKTLEASRAPASAHLPPSTHKAAETRSPSAIDWRFADLNPEIVPSFFTRTTSGVSTERISSNTRVHLTTPSTHVDLVRMALVPDLEADQCQCCVAGVRTDNGRHLPRAPERGQQRPGRCSRSRGCLRGGVPGPPADAHVIWGRPQRGEAAFQRHWRWLRTLEPREGAVAALGRNSPRQQRGPSRPPPASVLGQRGPTG